MLSAIFEAYLSLIFAVFVGPSFSPEIFAMFARSISDHAAFVHVFREILCFQEDSDPMKALAQHGVVDLPGFFSIPADDFLDFAVQETVVEYFRGQPCQVNKMKMLVRHHIGKLRSLSQWHCHLMSLNGKELTNEQWCALDKKAFGDFRMFHPVSTTRKPSVPPPPSVPAKQQIFLDAKTYMAKKAHQWINLDVIIVPDPPLPANEGAEKVDEKPKETMETTFAETEEEFKETSAADSSEISEALPEDSAPSAPSADAFKVIPVETEDPATLTMVISEYHEPFAEDDISDDDDFEFEDLEDAATMLSSRPFPPGYQEELLANAKEVKDMDGSLI